MKNYLIDNLNSISPVECPCGMSRRAFDVAENDKATLHLVEISEGARLNYHKQMTEIYLVLETDGDAFMQLDDEVIPVQPMQTIMIKPGCRHRAIGKMKIINVAIPAFDADDEFFN